METFVDLPNPDDSNQGLNEKSVNYRNKGRDNDKYMITSSICNKCTFKGKDTNIQKKKKKLYVGNIVLEDVLFVLE